MKNITLKNTDISISSLCLGTAGFGGDRIPQERAFELLDVWRDLGGTIVDTANVYGRWVDGTNMGERIIGKWLSLRGRHALTVATKCCHWSSDAPDVSRVRKRYAKADLEESLGALGLDCADICWLHRDDEDMPVAEIMGFCEDLRNEGLIRSYGLSNWSAERANAAWEDCVRHGYKGLMGVQNGHSAPVLPAGDPTLRCYTPDQGEFHKKSGIAEMPYSAIGNGAFCVMEKAGVRVSGGEVISVGDESLISADFSKRWFTEQNLRRYGTLLHYAGESGLTMLEACIAFHTGRDYTDIPVVATSRRLGLYELCAAAEKRLPPEAIAEVESI